MTIGITLTATILITFTACGDKEKQADTTKAKTIKTQTTVVNVTDTNGKEVTTADGKTVTEFVTIKNGTTKTTTTKPQQTALQTTTKPQKAPNPQPKVTEPLPPVQTNPYGYKNAWGSIATMGNDCKAYAESMGMTYRTDYTLETGHWTTPNASYGAPSPEAFKAKFCGSDIITSYQQSGYTNIRYLFVTMDNYQDGRCGKYTDNALMYLNGDRDKIIVYVVVT